jgi:hypothetical protein
MAEMLGDYQWVSAKRGSPSFLRIKARPREIRTGTAQSAFGIAQNPDLSHRALGIERRRVGFDDSSGNHLSELVDQQAGPLAIQVLCRLRQIQAFPQNYIMGARQRPAFYIWVYHLISPPIHSASRIFTNHFTEFT